MYDYGIISNNIGLIINKLFNYYTIGSIRFFNLLLILLNKIILVFICKKITEKLKFNQTTKCIFFIFILQKHLYLFHLFRFNLLLQTFLHLLLIHIFLLLYYIYFHHILLQIKYYLLLFNSITMLIKEYKKIFLLIY